MTRSLKFLSLIFVVALLASCSSTQFVSDSLGDVNAAKYDTYTMEENCADDINPIMQIRIKNAVETKMRSKDYSKSEDADILIKYFVKNLSKKYVEECREEYTRWEGGELCQERVINYVEGSIVIDIIDRNTNSIIWHGAAYGPSWSTISDPNKKVKQVISKLLERYFNA